MTTVPNKVPPDGGWGWCIVIGSSILNMFTRAIEPSFGLLFRDLLIQLNVETTGAAVIMGTLDSIINFSGLFVGPLMKVMSYRKVAFIGCFLTSTAYICTIFANSMAHLVISFSIIGGLGFGFASASTFVGLNSYFNKKKAQAVGLAMAGTATGFMAMPQIVSFLLSHYQFRGTLVILSALSFNTFVGASLLQPVKWHMKTVHHESVEDKALLEDSTTVIEEDEEKKGLKASIVIEPPVVRHGLGSSALALRPNSSFINFPLKRQLSLAATPKPMDHTGLSTLMLSQVSSSASLKRRPSMMSHVSLIDFAGSTVHIDYQDDDRGIEMKCGPKEEQPMKKKRAGWLSRIIIVMDLNLLKDLIYLNILYGTSVSYVSEFSWKLIVPFFLYDLGYNLQECATALSIMSIADILARVMMPPILDRLPYSRRSTMMFFLVILAAARSTVAMQTENTPLMAALIFHGFVRGVTLIGFPLVLSEYANKDNFPAVLGLSMVAKGMFIAIVAPIFGWVRDYTQSYAFSLHFQSAMIISCVVAWGIEYIIVKKEAVEETTPPKEVNSS